VRRGVEDGAVSFRIRRARDWAEEEAAESSRRPGNDDWDSGIGLGSNDIVGGSSWRDLVPGTLERSPYGGQIQQGAFFLRVSAIHRRDV
jgi:hypothetical protein